MEDSDLDDFELLEMDDPPIAAPDITALAVDDLNGTIMERKRHKKAVDNRRGMLLPKRRKIDIDLMIKLGIFSFDLEKLMFPNIDPPKSRLISWSLLEHD